MDLAGQRGGREREGKKGQVQCCFDIIDIDTTPLWVLEETAHAGLGPDCFEMKDYIKYTRVLRYGEAGTAVPVRDLQSGTQLVMLNLILEEFTQANTSRDPEAFMILIADRWCTSSTGISYFTFILSAQSPGARPRSPYNLSLGSVTARSAKRLRSSRISIVIDCA